MCNRQLPHNATVVDHNPDSAPAMAGIRVHGPRGARPVTKVNRHSLKRRHIAQIHLRQIAAT